MADVSDSVEYQDEESESIRPFANDEQLEANKPSIEASRNKALETVAANNKIREEFLAKKDEDERILANERAKLVRAEIWKQQHANTPVEDPVTTPHPNQRLPEKTPEPV